MAAFDLDAIGPIQTIYQTAVSCGYHSIHPHRFRSGQIYQDEFTRPNTYLQLPAMNDKAWWHEYPEIHRHLEHGSPVRQAYIAKLADLLSDYQAKRFNSDTEKTVESFAEELWKAVEDRVRTPGLLTPSILLMSKSIRLLVACLARSSVNRKDKTSPSTALLY